MIKFTLKCEHDHLFDSWFQSAGAYDKLSNAGLVTCAVCGSGDVEKTLMAPRVHDSRSRATAPDTESDTAPDTASGTVPDTAPDTAEQALRALKKQVEDNSEYVGMNFAREARDIHDGLTPERAIYGEARPDEAKKLIEDGIPVAPLPFIPGRKTN